MMALRPLHVLCRTHRTAPPQTLQAYQPLVQAEGLPYLTFYNADLQAEDTAILHAALKTNGTLTAESCARIMKLPRDQNSWPLPRSAKHIRARLDWLLTRLLSGSKKA